MDQDPPRVVKLIEEEVIIWQIFIKKAGHVMKT
jgi:hypothetical protein